LLILSFCYWNILETTFRNISYSCYWSNNEWLMTYQTIITLCSILYVKIQLHRVSTFVVLIYIYIIWQLFAFQYKITSIKSDTFNNITNLYRSSIFEWVLYFFWTGIWKHFIENKLQIAQYVVMCIAQDCNR
jgi:hypothetical protein